MSEAEVLGARYRIAAQQPRAETMMTGPRPTLRPESIAAFSRFLIHSGRAATDPCSIDW